MAPDLGDVIDVPLVLFALCLRNQLYVHRPGGVLSSLDGLIQILRRIVRIVPSCGLRLIQCEILDSLVSFKGVLDEENFSLIIDPLVGVSTVAVHVTVALGCASICVHDGKSVHGLRNLPEEVPHGIGVEKILDWVLFQCMEEVWRHHWVTEEETWKVDSNHVIVALLSVEFEGEASYISEEVRRALGADGC